MGSDKEGAAILIPIDDFSGLVIDVPGAPLQPGQLETDEVFDSTANSHRWFGIYRLPGPG